MQRITAIFLSLNIVEIMIDINKILLIESLKSRNIKVIVIIIDFIISNRVFDSIRISALLLYINVFFDWIVSYGLNYEHNELLKHEFYMIQLNTNALYFIKIVYKLTIGQ